MSAPGIPPGHLGDFISALLDGELSYEDAAAARNHMQGCAFCRAEMDSTATARSWLRGLPPLDPPAGLIEEILQRPAEIIPISGRPARRARSAVAVAGLAAAAALGFLAMAPHATRRVNPPVASFVDDHGTTSDGGEPVSGLAPVAIPASFSP